MLVASNTTLLNSRRTTPSSPSSAVEAGKLQLITNNTATTNSGTTSSSSSAQRSSSRSRSPVAIGSLCVRISRDTNGFKALLNKIPSDTNCGSTDIIRTPLFTINPTITHRCPQILDIHSRDSLVADMCIFDPINPVPFTPYYIRKDCQSLKSPKVKYPSLKHRKFSLQINKTSSLLRVKLLKPNRPSAFCFLGSKLKPTDKIHVKRVIGKTSKESPSFGYGQLQSNSTTAANNIPTPQHLYIEKKGTRGSRGGSNSSSNNNIIRNSSLDLQELQLSSSRPITRSFLRMMNNASKTK